MAMIHNKISILEALTFQGCRAGKVKTKERQGEYQRFSLQKALKSEDNWVKEQRMLAALDG